MAWLGQIGALSGKAANEPEFIPFRAANRMTPTSRHVKWKDTKNYILPQTRHFREKNHTKNRCMEFGGICPLASRKSRSSKFLLSELSGGAESLEGVQFLQRRVERANTPTTMGERARGGQTK